MFKKLLFFAFSLLSKRICDINHNNRSIITENVDADRIKNDIVICQKSLKNLYHELFDDALHEYNEKQKRRDRKISNYQEHIRHSRQEKEFYEVIFQVGNCDDTGIDSDACEKAVEVLKEYAENFQERNPHLKIFNAVIHLDESTPHLHLDFVPVSDELQKRGLRVRNSLTGALRQQGFVGSGIGHTITMDWLENEKEHIGQLMRERGIEWLKLGTHDEHLSVKDYKLKKRQEEIEQADIQLETKQKQVESAEYTLSYMQDKVNAKSAEVDSLREHANEILNYIPDIQKSDKLEQKYDEIRLELDEQIRTTFTIMKNKDAIQNNVDALENITKKALDMQYKSEDTVYDLRQQCDKITAERDEAIQKKNEYQKKYSRSERRNSELEEKISYFKDLLQLIEFLFPNAVAKAKEILNSRKDKEFEQEQQRIADRKKKRFELE